MRRSSLRALTVSGLGAIFFTCAGCGSTKITPGGSHDFAPQTGSNFGRRLPRPSAEVVESTTKVEKRKRSKAQKPSKPERTDADYMTRGGFR